MGRHDNGWELFFDETIIPKILRPKHAQAQQPRQPNRGNAQSTGAVLLVQDDGVEFSNLIKAEKDALVKAISFVPACSWTGCAMCKSQFDIDGLYFLAQLLTEKFGGFHRIDNKADLPEQSGNVVHHIEYRDMNGYFGDQKHDDNYIKEYERYVPVTEYWLIDAKTINLPLLDY